MSGIKMDGKWMSDIKMDGKMDERYKDGWKDKYGEWMTELWMDG